MSNYIGSDIHVPYYSAAEKSNKYYQESYDGESIPTQKVVSSQRRIGQMRPIIVSLGETTNSGE